MMMGPTFFGGTDNACSMVQLIGARRRHQVGQVESLCWWSPESVDFFGGVLQMANHVIVEYIEYIDVYSKLSLLTYWLMSICIR